MRSKTRIAVLSALSALTALSAAAFAAPAALAQDGAPGPRGGLQGDGDRRGDMRARMEAMRQRWDAQHVQDLKTVLRLRPDQEPALTA
ncbi:MAG: hypothetical protein JSS35_02065, partial [Proteobacteria bacterium]|nr:hypothetical protein [Pseudomonadota bacterium]